MTITTIMAFILGVGAMMLLTIGAVACPSSINAPIVAWYRHPMWSAMLVWRRIARSLRSVRRFAKLQMWSIEIAFIRPMVGRIILSLMDRGTQEDQMDQNSLRSLVRSMVLVRLATPIKSMVREEIENSIGVVIDTEIGTLLGAQPTANVQPTATPVKLINVSSVPAPVPVKVATPATPAPVKVGMEILVTVENRPAGQIVVCLQRGTSTGQISANNPRIAPTFDAAITGRIANLTAKDGKSTSRVVLLGRSGESIVYRPINDAGQGIKLALPVKADRLAVIAENVSHKLVSGAAVVVVQPPAVPAAPPTVQPPASGPIVAVKRGRGRPKGARNGTHNGQPVTVVDLPQGAGTPIGAVGGMAAATASIASGTIVTASGCVVSSVPNGTTPAAPYTIPALVKVNGRDVKPLVLGDPRLTKPRDLWLVRLDGTPRLMVKGDGSPIVVRSDGPRGAATIAGLARTPCAAVLPSEYGPVN